LINGVGGRLAPIQTPLEVAGMLAVALLTITGEAAGLTALGIRQTFYRGIGGAEAADFAATGALRAGGGNERKYLTNSIEAAAKWAGQKGNGPGSQILRIRLPQDAVRTFDRLGRIDGIGETWWAPLQSFNGASRRCTNHWSATMMHAALVHWIPAEFSSRKQAPSSLRYLRVSRFAEDGEEWPDGAWSVELTFSQPPSEHDPEEPSRAHVQFLFDEAPEERLQPSVRFGLYEGRTQVAEVEVLD